MSSRRREGHEESILAMLERDTGSRLQQTARVVGYGAAWVLILALLGTLVWLVRDNSAGRRADAAIAAANRETPAPPAITEDPNQSVHPHAQGAAIIETYDVAAAPLQSPSVAAAEQQVAAQVVSDEFVAAPDVAEQQVTELTAPPEPPPLVLLSPEEAADTRGGSPVKRTNKQPLLIVDEAPAAPDHETARPTMSAARSARPAQRVATRPVQRAAAAKSKKPTLAAPEETPVDRDVALLSAIIAYSSRHTAEREAATRSDNLP